ncbi:MAG: signal peptidase II [Candidatus Zixiibacteriota bacterium]
MRRYGVSAALVAVLLAADQITKYLVVRNLWPGRVVEVIPGLLNVTLCRNTGGAFSLFPDKPVIFTIMSLIAVGLLLYLFTRFAGKTTLSLAAATLLAGALGNLADRFRLGYVVDFIDLHIGGWHWYIFNIADAAITVGALSLFVFTFLDERRRSREAEPAPSTADNIDTE